MDTMADVVAGDGWRGLTSRFPAVLRQDLHELLSRSHLTDWIAMKMHVPTYMAETKEEVCLSLSGGRFTFSFEQGVRVFCGTVNRVELVAREPAQVFLFEVLGARTVEILKTEERSIYETEEEGASALPV